MYPRLTIAYVDEPKTLREFIRGLGEGYLYAYDMKVVGILVNNRRLWPSARLMPGDKVVVFPRVIGHYVREGVITIQEAVRKMTSAPAQRLGLKDRGLLREGFKADIVVFDPAKVKDEATFTNPHRFASGIPYVVVNGRMVVEGGEHTGALPGKALKKNA